MSSNKANCVGVSWGADTGVVSTATVTSKYAPNEETIKKPAVLANADGNRTPSLWLNVANDELLVSDGAKTGALRFPQKAVHSIINLLDPHTAKQTITKEKALNAEGATKKIKQFESSNAVEEEDIKKEADDLEEEMKTNFHAMMLHTDAQDAKAEKEFQGKFSAFLEYAKKNLKIDADGMIPKTSFKVEDEDEEGKPVLNDETRLPETTWECALAISRIFRTMIKDSLTGIDSPTSPNAPAASKDMPAGEQIDCPGTVVVSVPRHGTNAFAAYSLLHLAWNDWCTKSKNNAHPTQLKLIHDDVAALAAVLPKERLMMNLKKSPSQEALTTPHVALVVNWGATQLTVSLMLQTCEPVLHNNGDKAHPMMICLASKTLDREVGGNFIDKKVVETELFMTAKRKRLPTVEASTRGYRKFLAAAAQAKAILSTATTTSVEIEAAVEGMDFVDPSFTRSKFENVLSMGCKLPAKFAELMESVFAEYTKNEKFFPLFSSASGSLKKIKFGVVMAGGSLNIPFLQNVVKTQGNAALEKFLKEQVAVQQHQEGQVEITNFMSADNATPVEPQEICSVGACYLAQTGCVFAEGSDYVTTVDKNRTTRFAKPNLAVLSCDIGLLSKSGDKISIIFPSGCNVPAKRDLSAPIAAKDYSGFVLINKTAKTAVKIPFGSSSDSMKLSCHVTIGGVLSVTNGEDKVVEVQLE